MMRWAIAIWLSVLLATVACVPGVSASDDTDVPVSIHTQVLSMSPLIVTSFKTENSGQDISFLEIYNSGDALQRLSDWQITDTINQRTIVLDARDGYIEPNTHVVITKDGAVSGATYTIKAWSWLPTVVAANPPVIQAITNIKLSNHAYRSADTEIEPKYIDMWATRRYLMSGYSSTTFDPHYRALFDDGLYVAPSTSQGLQIVEIYPYSSSCDPFDSSILCGDYVKLFNISNHSIDLNDYVLRTDSSSASRTNANAINLGGELGAGEYRAVAVTNNGSKLSLTNSGGYVWLEDMWGLTSYPATLTRYESAGSAFQGYAYATDANGAWQWTSTPAPLSSNTMTSIAAQACPDGKYLNPDTNRCRSTLEETLNTLTGCEEGSERNITTNRCRK